MEGDPEHARITANIGINFASILVEPQLDVVPGQPEHWKNVLGFDSVVFNGDRKNGNNPNIIWNGETLFVIDHGLTATTWEFDRQGYPDSTLYGLDRIGSHAGYPSLRKPQAKYDDIRHEWPQLLGDDFLSWAIAQLPEEWLETPDGSRLTRFIRSRLAVAEAQADELESVLP